MRKDLIDIVRRGNDLGLRMVMSPCGKLLTREKAQELIEAGMQRISMTPDQFAEAYPAAIRITPTKVRGH